MAQTKQTPIQSKYSKTPLYRYANNNIDRSLSIHTPNYIPSLAHCYARYLANKAKWEKKYPDTPYPHSRPEADSHCSTAAHK